MTDTCAEITIFTKSRGSLTKHIHLIGDKIANDSSACSMASGQARRVSIPLDNIAILADVINSLAPNEAYGNGRLRAGLPSRVKIITDAKLTLAKRDAGCIARTQEFLVYEPGAPVIGLADLDFKGAPDAVKTRIAETGGGWAALCSVAPKLATCARVIRASTSSGLTNAATDQSYPDSGGLHGAFAAKDGADIARFLDDLSDRCWLANLAWGVSSACGSFLPRALVDPFVGAPERLIFEAEPVVDKPLVQAPRLAVAYQGETLDTIAACPPLTGAEKVEVKRLKDAEKTRLKPELDTARAKWSETHIRRLVECGFSAQEARTEVDRWIDKRELSELFILPFDDPMLAGTTVADVIAAPGKYVGKTLSDPHEGAAYGKNKAVLYQHANGLVIHSLAHGACKYELRSAPTPDTDAEIERLARLPALDYERAREAAASGWPPASAASIGRSRRSAANSTLPTTQRPPAWRTTSRSGSRPCTRPIIATSPRPADGCTGAGYAGCRRRR